jgi:hypothetical protein
LKVCFPFQCFYLSSSLAFFPLLWSCYLWGARRHGFCSIHLGIPYIQRQCWHVIDPQQMLTARVKRAHLAFEITLYVAPNVQW